MELITYLFYVVLIFVCIYFAPVVAIFPRIAADSRVLTAIPLLNIAFLYLIQRFLDLFHLYTPTKFSLIIFPLALVGLARYALIVKRNQLHYRREDLTIILLALMLCLPILSHLALSSFEMDDEIYSWNHWAKLFFLGANLDNFYTQAPYPQNLSILISNSYMLLGNFEYQLPVRAGLFVLPVICFATIGLFCYPRTGQPIAVVAIFALIYVLNSGIEFRHVLADPLMTICLVVGFYLLLEGRNIKSLTQLECITIASILISLALLTKQAALPWGFLFYPVILFLHVRDRLKASQMIVPLVLPILVGVVWILTEGSGFSGNEGVIEASFEGRGIVEQLIYGATTYLLHPITLAIFLLLIFLVFRHPNAVGLAIVFSIVASTSLWLLYGAYHFRLGMHIVFLAFLFSVMYIPARWTETFKRLSSKIRPKILRTLVLIIGILSIVDASATAYRLGNSTKGIALLEGSSRQTFSLLGNEGLNWINAMKKEGVGNIWVGSNYLYGAFYGVVPVIRFDRDKWTDEPERFEALLNDYGVSHAILVENSRYWFGRGNVALAELIALCPEKYRVLGVSKTDLQARLIKVENKDGLCIREEL